MQSPTNILFDRSLYLDLWAALQNAAIPDMTPEGEQTGKRLNRYARASVNVFCKGEGQGNIPWKSEVLSA